MKSGIPSMCIQQPRITPAVNCARYNTAAMTVDELDTAIQAALNKKILFHRNVQYRKK